MGALFSNALLDLLLVLKKRRQVGVSVEPEEALVAAVRLVMEHLGIELRLPQKGDGVGATEDAVLVLAECSLVRSRQVTLPKDEWRLDLGPLVAFEKESDKPLALIPVSPGKYLIYDVISGTVEPLNADCVRNLQPVAYTFFRPLPEHEASAWSLLKWGFQGLKNDTRRIIWTGILIAVLTLSLPVMVKVLFNTIIPSASSTYVLQFALTILTCAAVIFLLRMAQVVSIARVAQSLSLAFQSAVMDRLLNLPVDFFRQFSSGELAYRSLGVDGIRRILNDAFIQAFLSGVFSLFTLGLLYWFSVPLALCATMMYGVQVLYLSLIYAFYLGRLQEQGQASGISSGMAYELLSGISKIRVAGAEERAFSSWSKTLANQVRAMLKADRLGAWVMILNNIFPMVLTASVFAFILWKQKELNFSLGEFLGFNASLTMFTASLLSFSSLSVQLLSAVPLYRGLKPILHGLPEVNEGKISPGELTGKIELVRVSFHYEGSGRQILIDVNLKVEPGQMIAIVGPSGAGKSTILRLLLAFERPHSGSIYYEGQDLSTLHLTQLRRQIGVVLQNGKLFIGSILDNIIGSSLLTVDDAWWAAKMCGLDKDIEAMPMGMYTLVGGTGGLSGGQRQRILIARALVRKPKILFLDEATSALDNKTQEMVSESIEQLKVTRVVIAHRLSTIKKADCIYVLDQGRLVQSGSYNELIQKPGMFAELAKRQLS